MATRADYRNRLKDKILGLEDEGYGDFEYSDLEYNTYLELAVVRLFPHVYRKIALPNVSLTNYGRTGYASLVVPYEDRVYMVEDVNERTPVYGWSTRPGGITGVDDSHSGVNVYYYDAYLLPSDDVTDAGIPAIYTPLVVLGALVEALESRHDTGVRGDPGATGQHGETTLLDRLINRYEVLKNDLAMALPAVIV